MKKAIETLFSNFKVNNIAIPVEYLHYEGHGEPYVIYLEYDKDNSYAADDDIEGYVVYYDFDVYGKGNIDDIINAVKAKLKSTGWIWQPRRDSPDMYDADTEYYHKNIVFAYPLQIVESTDSTI